MEQEISHAYKRKLRSRGCHGISTTLPRVSFINQERLHKGF